MKCRKSNRAAVLAALLLARWTAGEIAPVLEEAPTLAENLGRAWPVVRGLLTGLLQFLTNESLQDSIASLQNQLNAVFASYQATLQAQLYTEDREAEAMVTAAHVFNNIGGTLGALGVNQQRIWYRLRYVIMPRTIQYIWNFVLHAWIWPLRRGLLDTINWDFAWFRYLHVFVVNVQAYAYAIQVTGRNFRAKYVYPQLTFLLTPWRVAYSYEQQITTAVARHLLGKNNNQTRDTISRVVWGDMSPLWSAFDSALAAWLQTDVSVGQWGADPPTYPKGASTPPPVKPPGNYEPWQKEHTEPPVPSFAPSLPQPDYVTH